MSMPQAMKAAVLVEQKKPLVITEVQLPGALEVGQVLVKVHFTGICGSQIGEIDGSKGPDKFLPHLLGHEASGTVIEVGPGVRQVKPKDKVVMHWRKGLGIEAAPPVFSWNGRKMNAGWVATFNEYAIVSENRLTCIPPDTDLRIASLFGCAVTTGFGVVENNAKVRPGESVVVFGAGGIGLSIVQAGSLVSAYPIVAVDLHDNRLDLAAKLGATHCVNAAKEDARSAIEAAVGKGGVDVFIDNTGLPAIIELGYAMTKPQGRVTLVGVPKAGANISLYSLPLHFGKILSGSHGGESTPERDIPRYLGLHRAGMLNLSALLTEQFPLDEINTAIECMRSGSAAGRCLIKLD